jgi:DsbC/DsbD-like thiol-disulfide interchange protein
MAIAGAARRLFFLVLLALLPAASRAGENTAWIQGHHSRARLVFGGAMTAGSVLAGIEIALDAGFKTYWRNPGESGLPPVFDWSRSENVAKAEVLWPAPTRLEDAGGVSYGYAGGVVLPVRVTLRDPGKPVRLALRLDYGVCKDICIPAHAELARVLSGRQAVDEHALIEEALARVPIAKPLGAEGSPSILKLAPAQGGADRLVVTARTPKGTAPRLFVEGPGDWFFADAAPENPVAEGEAERGEYVVKILERPRQAPDAIELRLTLVAGERAVETSARLDTATLAR